MKGRQSVLHIRCGDDIEGKLRDAGIAGDYLSFADPIWLGPPAAFNAWLAGRARVVADRSGMPLAKVRAELGEAYWRLGRAPGRYQRIVLWFEHDLYDQAALVRILATFAPRDSLPRLELICIDRFPGVARFVGLGQLTAQQLATLLPKRKPVTRRQLALGVAAWNALRADTPYRLEELREADLGALPFLGAALRRHLQELPWLDDGLSLTERLILAGLAKGPRTLDDLFAEAGIRRDPQPFMGDLFFRAVVRDLLGAPKPPIEVLAASRRLAWPRRVLRLTTVGRALLDGKGDWQDQEPPARWVCGIPVGPGVPDWRWDTRAGHTTRK